LLSRLTISLKEKDEESMEIINEIVDDVSRWIKKIKTGQSG